MRAFFSSFAPDDRFLQYPAAMDNSLSIFKTTIQFMKWFGLATLFGCNSEKNINTQGSLTSGPFEIGWEVQTSRSGAWFNNGGDFNAKVKTSWFSVKYKGKTVQVPGFDTYAGSLIEAPSKPKPVEHFWQALLLKDAPRPAVLVGIHSMHLITEENDQVKIIPLHEQESDFATYEWLDSDNGQPGPKNNVYLGDDSGSSRFLSGGRYLMVNSRVVLDVQTLEVYPFDLITYEVLQKLHNYHAGNSFIAQFSPGKTQMVLIGNRDNPENRLLYQYGLVVIDFKKNTAYDVPFDRTDTRFFSIWDASQQWINTYFEWTKDPAGEERIRLRKLDKLPFWQGRWSHDEQTGEVVQYELKPVEDTMLPAFVDYIRTQVEVVDEKTERIPHYEAGSPDEPSCYLVNANLHLKAGDDLNVYLNPVEQSLSLNTKNRGLIKQIGEGFDQEMQKGKFQEYFGRYK